MSMDHKELGAIENIYEENIETYKELMGIDDDRDLTDLDLKILWEAAEKTFNERG